MLPRMTVDGPPPTAGPDPHALLTDDDVTGLLAGIWRAGRALKQDVEPRMQGQFQVDLRQSLILRYLRGGLRYPKELAGALEVPATLVSRYLDGLLKQGLIERHIDEHDSRRTRLALTPDGERVTDQTLRLFRDRTRERLGDVSPTELHAATRLLERLCAAPPHPEQDPT